MAARKKHDPDEGLHEDGWAAQSCCLPHPWLETGTVRVSTVLLGVSGGAAVAGATVVAFPAAGATVVAVFPAAGATVVPVAGSIVVPVADVVFVIQDSVTKRRTMTSRLSIPVDFLVFSSDGLNWVKEKNMRSSLS